MPEYTGSLIDHLNIAVPDLQRSLAFYTPCLAELGIVELLAFPAGATSPDQPEMHGFGRAPKPFFWLIADGTAHALYAKFGFKLVAPGAHGMLLRLS